MHRPGSSRFSAADAGPWCMSPIQVPRIAVAQSMAVAAGPRLHAAEFGAAVLRQIRPARACGGTVPGLAARSPHARRPLGIPPGPAPLSRPPANARRKARRRFRRPARSGHGNHPWPDGRMHARAATALQRTPPRSARCRPGSLLAAHSQSRAFEPPGGPRSEERTRHRLITPAARDLPLLAVPFVRTVTSLGHRSSVHRLPRGGVCTRTPVRMISAERTQKLPLTHRPTALLRGSAPSPFRLTAKPSRASHG